MRAMNTVGPPYKGPLNTGHLPIKDTACCPHYIELCTNLPLNQGHLSMKDRQLGPMVSAIERFHCTPIAVHHITTVAMHTVS